MRGILIDPFDKTIEEIDYQGNWQEINVHIQASLFDVLTINTEGDAVYVDDEGLLLDINKQEYFLLLTMVGTRVLAGRGLILGTNRGGDTVGTTLDVEKVKHLVRFVPPLLKAPIVAAQYG